MWADLKEAIKHDGWYFNLHAKIIVLLFHLPSSLYLKLGEDKMTERWSYATRRALFTVPTHCLVCFVSNYRIIIEKENKKKDMSLWRLYWSTEIWPYVSKHRELLPWLKESELSIHLIQKERKRTNSFQSIQYQGTLKRVNNIFLSSI